jgi:hypothetical protein
MIMRTTGRPSVDHGPAAGVVVGPERLTSYGPRPIPEHDVPTVVEGDLVGTSLRDRVLYVVHVERGDRDRIISARPATGGEREVYESG